jgi:preprotein translocase subunit SecA
VLDDLWKDHLSTMDLRHGIHLRGYAEEPEAGVQARVVHAVQELLDSIKRDTIRVLSHVQVRREDPVEEEARLRRSRSTGGAHAVPACLPGLESSKWARRGRSGRGRAGAQRAEAGPQRAVGAVRARNSSIATADRDPPFKR